MSAQASAEPTSEGGNNETVPADADAPSVTAPAAPAAPPVAATIVTTGGRTEREIALADELAKEQAAHATTAAEKKAREQRINELEDELRKLKEVPPTPTPAPKPKNRLRLTFFDPAE